MKQIAEIVPETETETEIQNNMKEMKKEVELFFSKILSFFYRKKKKSKFFW